MSQKNFLGQLHARLKPFVTMFALTAVFIAIVQILGILYEAKLKADYTQWSNEFHHQYDESRYIY